MVDDFDDLCCWSVLCIINAWFAAYDLFALWFTFCWFVCLGCVVVVQLRGGLLLSFNLC